GENEWIYVNWSTSSAQVVFSSIIVQGRQEGHILQGLQPGVTYYIRMWTCDDNGNWSSISNAATAWAQVAVGDTTPPEAITTLSALVGDNEGEIKLSWISPGDDGWVGDITGGKYRIRYSTYVTEASDFWTTGTWNDYQNKYEIEWTTNTSPLANQARLLTGLRSGVTYYIRIWTADEVPNWSGISNAATAWAQVDITPPAAITTLSALVGSNEGEIKLSWISPGDDGWEPSGGTFSGYYAIQYSSYNDLGDFQVEDPNDYSGGFDFGQIYIADDANNIYFLFHNWDPVNSDIDFGDDNTSIYLDIDNNDSTGDSSQGGADRRIVIRRIGTSLNYAAIKYVYWTGSQWDGWNWYQEDNNPTVVNANQSGDGNQTLPKDNVVAGTSCGIFEVSMPKTYPGSGAQVNSWSSTIAWHIGGNDTVGSASNQYTYTLKGNVTRAIDGNTTGENEWIYVNWSTSSAQVVFSSSIVQGRQEGYILQGLQPGVTYYIRMWTCDDNGNWSSISNAATAWVQMDIAPPAAITTLSALVGDNEGEIKLTWISPGDDGWVGDIVGGKYRIRYSTYVTTAADFWTTGSWTDYQNKYEIEWTTNTSALSNQARLLTGLRSGVTYYIRIWTADEIPNWSNISNAATAWAQIAVTPPPISTTTILCYGEGASPSYVKYRPLYQGATYWAEELPTGTTVPQYIKWVKVEKCPLSSRDEYVMVVQGETPSGNAYIAANVYQNGVWVSSITLSSGLETSYRCFDVVYEQSSGDCMVVYSTNTNIAAYRIWNGSSWSSESSVNNLYKTTTSKVRFIKLAVKPGSDEIVMTYTDADRYCYASVWNGSSWGNHTVIEDGVNIGDSGLPQFEAFTVVYEQQSGRAVVFFSSTSVGGSSTAYIRAKVWNGTSWSAEVSSKTTNPIREIIAKPKPNSNIILLMFIDYLVDGYTCVWNGEYFGTQTLHNTEMMNARTHPFDAEWEVITGHENHCLLVYPKQTGNYGIVCKHSSDNGANWTTIADPISQTTNNAYNDTYLTRISTMIWLVSDGNTESGLVSMWWSIENQTWSEKWTLETDLSFENNYPKTPFWIASSQYIVAVDTTPPAAVTLYAETGPYPESVRLYWLAPGDDGDEKSLSIGSQYKIQIATFSSTTWDKSLAQITISTSGVTPGTQVEYIVTGLAENVTFYFRLWTADEVPNWSDPSNIASAKARVDYSSGTIVSIPDTCMVVYSEGSNGVRYRTLTPGTTTWSDEQPVPPINSGTIYWVKIVACPIRDEKAMITLDNYGNLRVSTYSDAGGWANSYFHLGTFQTNTPTTRRWFDICYSQQSGLLMVVYSTGTNVLAYRIFDGTNWSAQGSVGNLTGGSDRYPAWVSISPKPNSDEILLAYTDDKDRKCYGSVWDGSSWGNHIIVWDGDVNGATERCSVAVSYQWSNGVGVVIHANTSSQIVARQWNGTSWGSSVTGSAGTVPQFLVLKSNPNTNEIMVFYGNSSANTFAIKWTGSDWGTYTQIDNQGGGVHAYPISGEAETLEGHSGHWISLSNQANATGENGGLRSDHYDGNSWSIVQKPVHNTGSLGEFKSVMTTSLPNCNTFYALAVYGNTLYSLCWIVESSTWTQLVELENYLNTASPNPYISFWMTPNSELIEMVYKVVPDSVPPAAVNDLKVSLGYIDGQEVFFATWTAPGDNENEFILHEPSKFRIQYSTNPDTLWHYNSAQVEIPISIWGIPPGVEVSTIIVPSQPIQEGVTYYFYLWTADEAPNWSDKSNEAKCYIPKTLVHTVYYESTSPSYPKYRKWKEDETLSWEYSLPAIPNVYGEGAPTYYRMATSPLGNEAIAVFISSTPSNTTSIVAYRFNGSSWTTPTTITDNAMRVDYSGCLDVAYEQQRSSAIVVYRTNSNGNILKYKIWDGEQWSQEQNIATLSYTISWIKLYSKPQSNEIIAVAITFNPYNLHTFVWDGNSWLEGVTIPAVVSSSLSPAFDGIYEELYKRFILVASSGQVNGSVQYTIWDSTSWSTPQQLNFDTSDNPLGNYQVRWIKLASKSNSNEIVMVVSDASNPNIGTAVWNGTNWTINTTPLTTNTGVSSQFRPFDVAYEQNSGYAVVVYGDADYTGTPRYVRYHTSSGWSSPSSANSVGSTLIRWISLQPIKNTNQILMLCSDSETTPDLNFQRWDGASCKNLTEIETETSSRESFVMRLREDLYYIKDTTAPAAVTDLSGDVLAEGTVKLNWSTPGDDNWSGVLPCGSRYKIVY
ncbi:MAG: hypothetical protein QXO21_02255, partial [Candidatus Anstonellales archaeon]